MNGIKIDCKHCDFLNAYKYKCLEIHGAYANWILKENLSMRFILNL